ncbi:MAG: hypothetical protein JSS94_08790 [Bacteroidetes bacterium]|nr:hypothetical protein [Bacteroidota bacterium]
MKEQPLYLNKKTALVMATLGLLSFAFSFYLKFNTSQSDLSSIDFILGIGALLQFVVWLIVMVDIIRNPIHNKWMWYISLFTFAPLACILYLINRDKHM